MTFVTVVLDHGELGQHARGTRDDATRTDQLVQVELSARYKVSVINRPQDI